MCEVLSGKSMYISGKKVFMPLLIEHSLFRPFDQSVNSLEYTYHSTLSLYFKFQQAPF